MLIVRRYEFQEGGHYEFAYQVPNGPTMVVGGSFTLIQPPSKLAFTWVIEPPDEHAGIESIVIVSIDPDAQGSSLLIKHLNFDRPDAISRHAEGWRGATDLLAAVVNSELSKHG